MAHPGGRPKQWQDPVKMQEAVDAYFAKCDEGRTFTIIKKGEPVEVHRKIPYTVAGLALALDFTSRQSLLNYSDLPEFMDIITRAKLRIEQDNVQGGMLGEYESKITGLNLASNYGYTTRSEVDLKSQSIEDILRQNQPK